MFKYAVFAVLALVAFQQVSCEPIKALPIHNRGLIDDAKAWMVKFTNYVTDAINNAVTSLNNEAKSKVDYLNDLASKGVEEVQKVCNAGLDTIKVAVQAVQNMGLDPSACLGTVIEAIETMKQGYAKDIAKCVTDKIPEINVVLDKGAAEITAFNNEIKAAAKKLESCNGGTFCLMGFIADITVQAAKLPIIIINLSASYTKQIGEVAASTIKCITDNGSRLAKAVASNVDTTVKCLYNQLG